MAVLALQSTEMVDGYRGKPNNDHSKLRVQFFHVPAVAVAGDANTTIDLCDLPSGSVRIIPDLSRFACTAFGASRTLDIGHRAYTKTYAGTTTTEAEDPDAFMDGLDVSGALTGTAFGSGLSAFGYKVQFDLHSKDGVTVFATVLGGTIPVNTTISGFIAYTYE